MGLSSSKLVLVMTVLIIILILLLAFILLGLNAFTPGGIFNSVINSLIPVIAGTGVGRSGGPKFNKEELRAKLEGILKEIKSIMGKFR